MIKQDWMNLMGSMTISMLEEGQHYTEGLYIEHVQGHPVQASGDNTILQCYVASHQALQSREDSIQEEQDVLRDHETVEEEIQRLRRQFLCKTCLKEKACIVFIPCGHLSACPACAEEVLNCNVCQQDIKATVKAYCA